MEHFAPLSMSSDHRPQSHFVSSDDQMGKDAHVL